MPSLDRTPSLLGRTPFRFLLLVLGWIGLTLAADGQTKSNGLNASNTSKTSRSEPRRLTASAARGDIALLRKAFEEVHPGYLRYASRDTMEAAFAKLDGVVAKGIDDTDFYREVSEVAAMIRCGHTRVEAPEWLGTYRAANPTHLPFRFRLIDGRMLIDIVADDAAKRLTRGDEVLVIDGTSVAELVDRLDDLMVIDGKTDHIRPSRLDTAYEFADSGFDHYLPLLPNRTLRTKFELEVRRPPEASTPASPSSPSRDKRSVVVPAIIQKQWTTLATGPADFADAVRLEQLDKKTALIEVASFVNYRRPVDPEKRLAPLFRQINDNGTEHLILELRPCGGGSTEVSWILARFLAPRAFVAGKPPRVKNIRIDADLRKHLKTWDETAFSKPAAIFDRLENGWYELKAKFAGIAPVTPHPDRFHGRITILVGPYNASGATLLLAQLQPFENIRLVGRATGGSAEGPTAGLIFFLDLPNSGIRVNVPAVFERSTAEFEPGLGVTPDVVVNDTVEDFLAERDAVLETARKLKARKSNDAKR